MNIKFSAKVDKAVAKIDRTDRKLGRRIEKQLILFASDPTHPSLRLHKLSGKQQNTWSISITMSIRMVYRLIDENTAYFTSIGTHEEVYET
jgi:mRNA-degrading endonuclease YafQ of YafQ-DinJ toxin-antitoxin module